MQHSKGRQFASALGRLLVAALAAEASVGASHAQDAHPEVKISWDRDTDTALQERFSTGLSVRVDRAPGRPVSYTYELALYGGATYRDFAISGHSTIPSGRTDWTTHIRAIPDDDDDDCEWVEVRLKPISPGVTVTDQPLRVRIVDDDGAAVDCGPGWPPVAGDPPSGGGGPPPEPVPEPEPEPEPESEPASPSRVAPYWHGTGGFAVRPADGESATVRIECAGRSYTSREHAGEDGLIVRTVSQPMCTAGDGGPIEGELTFEGIDADGWYWVNGDRNVAVAPLVREESLNPELRPPVPNGVTARPSGDRRFVLSVRGTWHGTLMVHDESGFMGIVPHLVDLEGAGEHVAAYWKGGGGIVGRPVDGSRATVRLACGEADAESQVLEAGEDGLIVALLPGCFGEDGAAVSGRLEADGMEDGAWYWLNTGTASASAPLLRRGADVDLTAPVLPAGVDADEGPLGTLLSRGPLMGVVPRVERIEE
ncbi:MAG: hypothetical protein F4X59_17960 [Holophagales bacterium]|nr:hypothetical protein [Holophagales bacterium]